MPPELDELDPPLLDDPPDEPDRPELDEPELPLSSSDWSSADAFRLELGWPSPCDELPRSRLELLDEPPDPLDAPCFPLDEPEMFWSRSAMMLSSKML
jgi:hypothetical protein